MKAWGCPPLTGGAAHHLRSYREAVALPPEAAKADDLAAFDHAGRGTYLAEHAAKIDQYVHVDQVVMPPLPLSAHRLSSPLSTLPSTLLSTLLSTLISALSSPLLCQSLRLHAAGDPLQPLHRRLYQRNAKHAGSVYYALVCRCVLGTPTRAKNGAPRPCLRTHA